MSAAPAARTFRGSSARRMDSSAASGTSVRRRSPASSARVAQGCSAYSRPNRPSARSWRAASSTVQPPLASTRIRPAGPSASRTASTRSRSAAAGWPGSATLTLAVRQPDPATMAWACSGPTAGTVTLTGTLARAGAGHPVVAASIAQASQRADSRGPYSANGENSPHPAGPSISAPSRTVMPRNRVGMGMAKARTESSSAGSSSLTPAVAGTRAPGRRAGPRIPPGGVAAAASRGAIGASSPAGRGTPAP